MSATTIKIENPILSELHSIKPKEQSLTAFVRSLLEGAVRRHRLAEAADAYVTFLEKNPAEQEWLDEWLDADLTAIPQSKKVKT